VGGPDFVILTSAFGSQAGDAHWNPDVDLNHDGTIGGPDFVALSGQFGSAPGPSGLSCAGTVPCP